MPNFDIPASGIQIQHKHTDSKPYSQIIRLNLAAGDAEDLVRCVRDGETARIKTGRVPQVVFGTKHVSVHHSQDKFPQEIFAGSLDGNRPAYFSGRLSHTLEVQQAKEATAGVDEALEKLKNNLKQSQDERIPTDPGSIGSKLLKSQHRPSPLGGGLLSSRPSSPFLSAGFSPRSGPTSAPLISGQSKEEKIKLAAIKIPVIHLLAVEQLEPKKLIETLRVKKSDLDQVLLKVAQDGQGGKKKLKDRSYRELDVWKFPYQSQNDRQSAIDHAVSAYDRQRIDKSDNIWQMLLAKEDRNKGINLSRLNFDKPLATGNLTPKVPEKSTDGGSTEGKSMKSTSSDQATQKGKAAAPKLTDTHPKTKPNADKLAKSLKDLGKSSTSKTINRPKDTKANTKFKSSERVEDSDEEANAGPSVTASAAKRGDVKQQKQSSSNKPTIPTAKAPLHKPHLSGSSGTSSDLDRGRLTPSSSTIKNRGGKDAVGVVDNSHSTKHPDRNSSRPRNGSSPIKPSPLGSSPPTKSHDIDSASNSSKSTTLSSAPSSPPSTSDSSQTMNRRPTLAKDREREPEKLANGIKRKAKTSSDGPPAKKQHLTNGKNDVSRFNILPPLDDALERQPPSKRDSPDSDSSSGTDKPISREDLVREARKFHKFYAIYKDLHDKLNQTAANDRDDGDLDQVWKQHMRLKEMKEQIWKDWGKLEKLEKT